MHARMRVLLPFSLRMGPQAVCSEEFWCFSTGGRAQKAAAARCASPDPDARARGRRGEAALAADLQRVPGIHCWNTWLSKVHIPPFKALLLQKPWKQTCVGCMKEIANYACVNISRVIRNSVQGPPALCGTFLPPGQDFDSRK